jgi:hypothetical protein
MAVIIHLFKSAVNGPYCRNHAIALIEGVLSEIAILSPVDESCYLRPRANLPSVAGRAVITSGPLVFPAMMVLSGMVS